MYRRTIVLSYDKHGYTHSDNKGEINQDERQGDRAIAKSKFHRHDDISEKQSIGVNTNYQSRLGTPKQWDIFFSLHTPNLIS